MPLKPEDVLDIARQEVASLRLCRVPPADREDLVQAGAERALRAWGRLSPDRTEREQRAYLGVCARSGIYDALSARGRALAEVPCGAVEVDDLANPEDLLIAREVGLALAEVLTEALARMGPHTRAVALAHLGAEPLPQSLRAELRPGTFWWHAHRARAVVRAVEQERGWDAASGTASALLSG
jgi:DNA-directed RNA polymerase specialized sigma24 family protein